MRRVSAMTAILASVAYAMLATWHGVLMPPTSTSAVSLSEASIEMALKTAICHGALGNRAHSPDVTRDAPQPAPDTSDCLACTGLACCQLVLLVAAEVKLSPPSAVDQGFVWIDELGADRASITPRSRGPPGTA